MFPNGTYNLLEQLSQEHKSLWRIKDEYLKDAAGDAAAVAFWTALATDKEKHIEEIKRLLTERMH